MLGVIVSSFSSLPKKFLDWINYKFTNIWFVNHVCSFRKSKFASNRLILTILEGLQSFFITFRYGDFIYFFLLKEKKGLNELNENFDAAKHIIFFSQTTFFIRKFKKEVLTHICMTRRVG